MLKEIYIMEVSGHCGIKNYAWRLDIVQNSCKFYQFFISDFLAPKFPDFSKFYTAVINGEI